MKVAGMHIDLPSNWQWSKCNDVMDVRDGTHDTPKYTQFGYPLITSKNLKSDGIDFSDVSYISEEDHRDISKRSKVDKNDILFAMIGTIGNPVIVETDKEFSVKNVALFKFAKSCINPVFFKYLLGTPIIQRQLTNETRGGTQKFVSLTVLRNMLIPYPPPEEQKRIAAILDKADRVRRKRQEAIRLTEELGRSIFLDMFGDPVTNPKELEIKPLGNIATFLGGGTPARNKDEYFQGEICWASSKDMGNDVLVDTQEHITQEAIDNSSTKLVPQGTLLVVVKSKILMKRLPVSRTAIDTCFNQDIKAIVPKDKSFTRYLQAHLKLGQETLLRQARGVNTEGLTLEHLRKYPVLMPKQESIKKFTIIIQELEKMLFRNRRSFQESENLFNSLLQRAFRGEL